MSVLLAVNPAAPQPLQTGVVNLHRIVPLMPIHQPAHNWVEKASDGVIRTTSHPAVYYPFITALDSVADSKNGAYQAGSVSNSLVKSYAYRQSVIQLAKAENSFLKNHPWALEWVNNHPWLGGAVMSALVIGPSMLLSEGAGIFAKPVAKKVETFAWQHLKGTAVGSVLQQLWKGVLKVFGNVYVMGGLLAVLIGALVVRMIRSTREAIQFKRSYQQARQKYDVKQVDPLTLRYAVMMAKLQPQTVGM
ncbi:MAG: hypothetical protein QE263_01930 [Vampirovibrionales bacterium]|nr:hypothetical protein [Vampirovibrionales bacterium]